MRTKQTWHFGNVYILDCFLCRISFSWWALSVCWGLLHVPLSCSPAAPWLLSDRSNNRVRRPGTDPGDYYYESLLPWFCGDLESSMHWSDCFKFTLCHRKVPKWKETVLSVASTLLSAHNLTMQCSVFYRCQLTVMRCSTFMHYTFKGFQGSRAKSWHKAKCPCFQEVLICAVTMAIKCYRHASKSYL